VLTDRNRVRAGSIPQEVTVFPIKETAAGRVTFSAVVKPVKMLVPITEAVPPVNTIPQPVLVGAGRGSSDEGSAADGYISGAVDCLTRYPTMVKVEAVTMMGIRGRNAVAPFF